MVVPEPRVLRPEDKVKCRRCMDKGFLVYDVPLDDPRHNQLVRCNHEQGDDDEFRRRYGLEAWMRNCTFENTVWGAEILAAVADARKLVDAGQGFLVLAGPPGVGKSRLLWCVVNRALRRNLRAWYGQTTLQFDELRKAYELGAKHQFSEKWEDLLDVPVLCLDEFLRFNETPWAVDKFYALVMARFDARGRLLTCLAGNTKIERLPDALRSRVEGEGCHYHVVLGPDHRKIADA